MLLYKGCFLAQKFLDIAYLICIKHPEIDSAWYTVVLIKSKMNSNQFFNKVCPNFRRGHGKASHNRVTNRRFVYAFYKLLPENTPPDLEQDLQEFERFLTEKYRSDRRFGRVELSTAETYISHVRLMMGWFLKSGTPKKSLCLDLLIPKLSEEALDSLTSEQRARCWKSRKQYIDRWVCQYFRFLKEEEDSGSPNTKGFKINALIKLGKFQYRNDVFSNDDYRDIPVLITLTKHSILIKREINIWKKANRRVVPIDKQWPAVVEGQTALGTIRTQVTEELQRLCSFRYSSNNHIRAGSAIASSLRDCIAWGILTDTPARRQEELRSWRLALTCPIERPDNQEIPEGCFYQPLPPRGDRTINSDTLLSEDNYLYKTYKCNGKEYPEGIWILDIATYKTQKRYGSQSIVIKDRKFQDGTCFYFYLEAYLYGVWHPIENNNSHIYSWWDKSFQGRQGRWITRGRSEFEPEIFLADNLSDNSKFALWGFFFIMPREGRGYNSSAFNAFSQKASHKLIGVKITPHIIRDMWATWAYQVGLTDAQRESLAYSMGMDVKTMREIYEKCSPEEKRRPIEEAIDNLIFSHIEVEAQQSGFDLELLADEILAQLGGIQEYIHLLE